MRNQNDRIWGIWPSDDLSPALWDKMNKLIEKHGLELDIIYDNSQFNYEKNTLKSTAGMKEFELFLARVGLSEVII